MNKIKLVPFSKENMPTVLSWRNSKRIRSNMLDDSIISEAAHQKFLEVLAVDQSKEYFVVELNGLPVASIYFTDLNQSCVTWGCYIGVVKPVPGLFIALLILAAKFVFFRYQAKVLRSEVAAHNSNPIKLNKFFGIPEKKRIKKITTKGEETEFIEYRLERCDFDSIYKKAYKVMPTSVKGAVENFFLEN
jgi:UDP-4-amino-4,6-dideoxy-N-acetyl-beta-L-altrosamine N-acetyltransferase